MKINLPNYVVKLKRKLEYRALKQYEEKTESIIQNLDSDCFIPKSQRTELISLFYKTLGIQRQSPERDNLLEKIANKLKGDI